MRSDGVSIQATETSRAVPRDPTNPIERAPRAALGAFLALLVLAAVVFLRAGRDQWFVLDEWDFLSSRAQLDVNSLFSAHFGHWVTIPYLVYRSLYQVFGLNSYLPYQLVSIGCHLGLAGLVRDVMRRAGVGPWLATAFAGAFALFGTGSENVIWAFQIGFTASLAFGVIHLILADHDGPFDRRDWLGLLAGAAGVMSSTPGVLMIVAVGIAVAMRRGRRLALLHTLPLLGLFAVWASYWILYKQAAVNPGKPDARTWVQFVANGFRGTFGALGWWPIVGVALFVLTVVGVGVSTREMPRADWMRRASGPLAMLVGGLLFIASAGFERAGQYGAEYAYLSRYLHMVAAFLIPLIAFAAQAVVVRWPITTGAVVVLPLLGIPGNISAADHPISYLAPTRALIVTMPRTPLGQQAPADAIPGVHFSELNYTIGFLRDAVAEGRLTGPASDDPAIVAQAVVRLALGQIDEPSDRPCQRVDAPVDLHLRLGDEIKLGSEPIPITVVTDAGPQTAIVDPAAAPMLVVQVPDLHVTAPADAASQLQVCR